MNNIKGTTLIETTVAVAVVGVMAAVAVPGYQYFVGKSQASEVVTVMNVEKTKLASAMKSNRCTASGVDEVIKTKYGTLTIGGSYKSVQGENCAIGCTMTYTFSNDVKKSLKGKVVKVDVLQNLKLHQNAGTTIEAKYLPATFTTSELETGAMCADLKGNQGSVTGGSVSGVEVGDAPPPPSEGSSTAPPSEPTLQEQVERAKTFRVDMGGSTNADVRHSASAMIVIPRGEHADYYQPGNWNVNDWNTRRFYVDWDNTNWRNNRFIKDSYVIRIYTNNSKMIRSRVYSTYCAEGGGCYNSYEYVHTLNLYYKGQYIRTYSPVSRVPEPPPGAN